MSKKHELRVVYRECMARGLINSAKWAAEQLVGCVEEESVVDVVPTVTAGPEDDVVSLAKTYFDLKEFDRVSHLLRDCETPLAVFLGCYAKFLAGERRREDGGADVAEGESGEKNGSLPALSRKLREMRDAGKADAFCLYLLGVVLGELDLRREAMDVYVAAVTECPTLWAAWLGIAGLCTEFELVHSLGLPDHWVREFFLAHLQLEMQHNEESLERYTTLAEEFPQSTYVLAQTALAKYNLRDFDEAENLFEVLISSDPYRLETMDTYSNILYVKEMYASLSFLAHHASATDKYKPETCCIIGNYYSLKSEHEKAVQYFQRALKLNKKYISAWTLMGHEFVEMKNIPAAVEAYRRAVDISPRDYRAWYGLGQTYEILQMPFYSLYYYRKSTTLRPYDARMWCAMANCYEHLGRVAEAIKCYQRAESADDRDWISLARLAALCVTTGDKASAAMYYERTLKQHEEHGIGAAGVTTALVFLARYYHEIGRTNEATKCAAKVVDFGGPEAEEAKALLRELRASA